MRSVLTFPLIVVLVIVIAKLTYTAAPLLGRQMAHHAAAARKAKVKREVKKAVEESHRLREKYAKQAK